MNFITGGTGFVGSAIILELLHKTDQVIYCLARPNKTKSAEERLIPLLKDLTGKYGYDASLLEKIDRNCRVVEGDLTDPELYDKIVSQVGEVRQFWHIAASLNYEERFRDEIYEINLEGTKRALKIAENIGVEYFNHFSTAYVAGKSTGLIKEEAIQNVACNNVYEISKIEAEREVLSATGFNTRIFRPSIVIGHSKTLYAFNFSGLYGFHRRVNQFVGMMQRVQQDYFDNHKVRIKADPNAFPNLVPVDFVAKHAVKAVLGNSPYKFHHLTNPSLTSTQEILDAVFTSVGVPVPEYVSDEKDFNSIDEKFNDKINFYTSYLTGQKMFDRENINAAIEEEDFAEYEIDPHVLQQHVDWYGKVLNRSSAKPKPVLR